MPMEWAGLDVHSGQRSGPAKVLVQTGDGLRAVPVPKAAKAKGVQHGACSGRLPLFQATMVCGWNRFEDLLEPAAKRR
jgi:hypothetical protein